MTWKPFVTVALIVTLTVGAVVPAAQAGTCGSCGSSGAGKAAAKGAGEALLIIGGAVLGTLTVAGLTTWYFVARRRRAREAQETVRADLTSAATSAIQDVKRCVTDTGELAVACW